MEEDSEAQKGSRVFQGSHSEGGPGGARTPVVALAPLLALTPHCASDPLAKSTRLLWCLAMPGCTGASGAGNYPPNTSSQTSSLAPSAGGTADSEFPLK